MIYHKIFSRNIYYNLDIFNSVKYKNKFTLKSATHQYNFYSFTTQNTINNSILRFGNPSTSVTTQVQDIQSFTPAIIQHAPIAFYRKHYYSVPCLPIWLKKYKESLYSSQKEDDFFLYISFVFWGQSSDAVIHHC